MSAVWQIVTPGSEQQRRDAVEILVETRRKLYGILADGEAVTDEDGRARDAGMNDDHLRISDEERERAGAELGEHYAQGRLDHAEHAERLDRVWAARTRGELAADLPRPARHRLRPRPGLPAVRHVPQRPGAPAPWVGGPVARRQRGGLGGVFVAVLGVLLVITVLTHLPVFFFALLAWFLISRAGRRSRSRGGLARRQRRPEPPVGSPRALTPGRRRPVQTPPLRRRG